MGHDVVIEKHELVMEEHDLEGG